MANAAVQQMLRDDAELVIANEPAAVRVAEFRDCHRVTRFLEQMHATHKMVPKFVPDKARKMLQIAVSNPKLHKVWIAEVDGRIEGVLIGVTNQVWYSTQKEALDLVFVVSDRGRGYGGMLARRFVHWARNEAAGVKQVWMSETVEADERTERMLERLGFRRTGGMYHQEVRQNEQSD